MANSSPVGLGETLFTPELVITAKVGSGGVAKGQVVKLSAAMGLDGIPTVVAAGAGEQAYGVALQTGAAGAYITVLKRGHVTVTAAGSITAGAMVKPAANGKVQSATAFELGWAETGASSDGDTLLVRVML